MLNANLKRFAEQIALGEIPSVQDEDVIAQLHATLVREAEARAARVSLVKTLRAGEALRPVLVQRG